MFSFPIPFQHHGETFSSHPGLPEDDLWIRLCVWLCAFAKPRVRSPVTEGMCTYVLWLQQNCTIIWMAGYGCIACSMTSWGCGHLNFVISRLSSVLYCHRLPAYTPLTTLYWALADRGCITITQLIASKTNRRWSAAWDTINSVFG